MWKFVRRSSRAVFFVILPTVLVCLVLMEIGLRAVGRLPSNTTDGVFARHGNSYRMKKNITKLAKTPVYSCTVRTNSFGFRDKTAGPRIIGSRPYYLFLGESLTFGNGVEYEQSFAGAFAQLVEKDGVEVVNLAIGGHYFHDQEEFFHDVMASVSRKPAKVIVCFSPLFVAGFDQQYTDIIIKNGYILSKTRWLLPYIRLTLGNASAAYCFFRDNIRKIQSGLFNYPLKFARLQLDFFARDNRLATPPVVESLETKLAELDAYIRDLGAAPIYVYLPSSTDFSVGKLLQQTGDSPDRYDFLLYYRLLQKHCLAHQIHLINLIPTLQNHYDKGEVLNFVQDPHYNAAANRIIVDEIYCSMAEHGDLIKP